MTKFLTRSTKVDITWQDQKKQFLVKILDFERSSSPPPPHSPPPPLVLVLLLILGGGRGRRTGSQVLHKLPNDGGENVVHGVDHCGKNPSVPPQLSKPAQKLYMTWHCKMKPTRRRRAAASSASGPGASPPQDRSPFFQPEPCAEKYQLKDLSTCREGWSTASCPEGCTAASWERSWLCIRRVALLRYSSFTSLGSSCMSRVWTIMGRENIRLYSTMKATKAWSKWRPL